MSAAGRIVAGMNIIFVPGFWLQGSSWERVVTPLREAGFIVHTPTLAGLHSVGDDRSEVTLASQTAEIVALVDAIDADASASDAAAEPIVLVGHSGGGSIIHGVVDARPDRITRAVYVDSWPTAEGIAINADLEADGADVPLPTWETFGEADLAGLTDELRATFRAIAVPEPARVARDPQHLTNPARYAVPITIIASTFTKTELDGYIASGHPMFAEFPPMHSVTVLELPTGHWPQFSRPSDLSAALLEALTP